MKASLLCLVPFGPEHFAEYASWFEKDEDTGKFLGDIDKEWLEWVTSQERQAEFAVFKGCEMVAEVGIVLPVPEHPYLVITNISVHPARRGQGIGHVLWNVLKARYAGKDWRCYVDKANTTAQDFFRREGWCIDGIVENGMIPFTYVAVSN